MLGVSEFPIEYVGPVNPRNETVTIRSAGWPAVSFTPRKGDGRMIVCVADEQHRRKILEENNPVPARPYFIIPTDILGERTEAMVAAIARKVAEDVFREQAAAKAKPPSVQTRAAKAATAPMPKEVE